MTINNDEVKQTIQKLTEIIPQIRNIDITVMVKRDHYPKCEELRKVLNSLSKVNVFIYDPDYYNYFTDYSKAIEHKHPKKDLDNKLRLCKTHLLHDVLHHIGTLQEVKTA